MVRVTLSGKVLAESDKTIVVENNHYFPPDSVEKSLLNDESATSSVCPWKGSVSFPSSETFLFIKKKLHRYIGLRSITTPSLLREGRKFK